MWKIVKKSVENIILNKHKFSLWMKWEFKIEFASDSFWPYNFKFQREDCYFNDWLEDRGSFLFPLKNEFSKNTEIFLETDDVVIAVWERWSLVWGDKDFIDIINIKTEKKYRLFTSHVGLIFNSADKIIINAEHEWVYKTLVLDIKSMEKIEEIPEELQAFFKSVYNKTTDEWFLLDFSPSNLEEQDEEKKFQQGSFTLQKKWLSWKPIMFDRKKFMLETDIWKIDIWNESKE